MKQSYRLIPESHTSSASHQNLRLEGPVEDFSPKAEELKSALVKRLKEEYTDVDARLVYLAVNEAHALASLTSVPLLLLPLLAEEKVQQAGTWFAHQRSLHQGKPLAFAA